MDTQQQQDHLYTEAQTHSISNGARIGFFDSGVGGFTILSAVRGALPEYDYVYYGDTAHLPYGDKTEDEVYAFTLEAIRTLFDRGVTLAIIACNTASAETLRKMQDALIPNVYADRRILGVIIPTIETIIDAHAKSALLIATRRTVNSKKYDIELAQRDAEGISLTSVATPELVPLLEQGKLTEAMIYLETTIDPLVGEVDTLVLGCTHYVLLKGLIRKRYPKIRVISQDEIIPKKLAQYLDHHPEIQTALGTHGSLEIILTKDDDEYRKKMLNLFAV